MKGKKMKRFENAQVGDEVYCRKRGKGIIIINNRERDIKNEIQNS